MACVNRNAGAPNYTLFLLAYASLLNIVATINVAIFYT